VAEKEISPAPACVLSAIAVGVWPGYVPGDGVMVGPSASTISVEALRKYWPPQAINLTRRLNMLRSGLQESIRSRRGLQAMIAPLAKAATPSGCFPEVPNPMIVIRKTDSGLPTDGVIGSCCRVATAAYRCLAVNKPEPAERNIFSRRVNNTGQPPSGLDVTATHLCRPTTVLQRLFVNQYWS
jgi:hypothetical protein